MLGRYAIGSSLVGNGDFEFLVYSLVHFKCTSGPNKIDYAHQCLGNDLSCFPDNLRSVDLTNTWFRCFTDSTQLIFLHAISVLNAASRRDLWQQLILNASRGGSFMVVLLPLAPLHFLKPYDTVINFIFVRILSDLR